MPKFTSAQEDGVDLSAPEITEEDKYLIKKSEDALDADRASRNLAKFKIDLQFSSGYSTLKPSVGILSFWESASKLHGGGDGKLYMCPSKTIGISDCEAFIPTSAQGEGFGLCADCEGLWKDAQLVGEVGYVLTSAGWAEVLFYWFKKMNMLADLRIKYPPDDIRKVATKEQNKQLMGELLSPARNRRVTRIYPLANIIKDTSAGADIEGRILSFVKA